MADILSLSAQLGKFEDSKAGLPPIHEWSPELSGDLDMEIKASGEWIHEGEPILREKLTKLFSTILKRENNDYFLVTPVEKWRIRVEDQPFSVVLADYSGDHINLITNLGDEIILDSTDKWFFDDDRAPKVLVRDKLWARLNRNVFYEMAGRAYESEDGFWIEQGSLKFKIG